MWDVYLSPTSSQHRGRLQNYPSSGECSSSTTRLGQTLPLCPHRKSTTVGELQRSLPAGLPRHDIGNVYLTPTSSQHRRRLQNYPSSCECFSSTNTSKMLAWEGHTPPPLPPRCPRRVEETGPCPPVEEATPPSPPICCRSSAPQGAKMQRETFYRLTDMSLL